MNATTETSLEAKDAIRPHVLSLRERVYSAIQESGENGLTDEAIQERLGMSGSTERPRRGELVKAGRIRPRIWVNGQNLLYPGYTSSGRKAVVWVAC